MTSTQAEPKIENYKQLPLFGDAMSALIPLEWLDVSDYRPVPDNQEMFSDFNSESPSMVCVEIVERVGDNVTGVQSSSVREEDNLAKFYLEDLKELMDATTPTRTTSNASTTKDWRFELSNGKKEEASELRAIFEDGRALYVRAVAKEADVARTKDTTDNDDGDDDDEVRKRMEDLLLTLPAEEGEEEEKKKNDNDNADYIKKKCEWISFAEERNCLVPSKDKDGNDSTRSVTISMYAHRLEKKYETDILVSFVRPTHYSGGVVDETEEHNNPGTVAAQTLQMLDWSLLGFDEEDEEEHDDDDDDDDDDEE